MLEYGDEWLAGCGKYRPRWVSSPRPSYPGRHKQNITIKNCDCDKIHLM